ncbi:MAG: hypothetical protein WD850_03520 [Candidatus Spechtbacterales bacterium]
MGALVTAPPCTIDIRTCWQRDEPSETYELPLEDERWTRALVTIAGPPGTGIQDERGIIYFKATLVRLSGNGFVGVPLVFERAQVEILLSNQSQKGVVSPIGDPIEIRLERPPEGRPSYR